VAVGKRARSAAGRCHTQAQLRSFVRFSLTFSAGQAYARLLLLHGSQVRSPGGREIETLVLIKKINPPGIQLNPRHASQGGPACSYQPGTSYSGQALAKGIMPPTNPNHARGVTLKLPYKGQGWLSPPACRHALECERLSRSDDGQAGEKACGEVRLAGQIDDLLKHSANRRAGSHSRSCHSSACVPPAHFLIQNASPFPCTYCGIIMQV
jgi:hypothetical protein